MALAHCGRPGLEVVDGSGRCKVAGGPHRAVSRYHANLPIDPVIDVEPVIDGVVELDGADLGADEEQCLSGFVVLGMNNKECYWYPDLSQVLVGDYLRNFKRLMK